MKNNSIKVSHILNIVGGLILMLTLSSCAILSSAKRVEGFFLEAEESYRLGDYNTAIKKYNLHSALVLTHFGIFRQTHVTKGSKQYK